MVLQAVLGPFQECRMQARWFAAVLGIIVQQRGCWALDIAHYAPVWVTLHFVALSAAYLSFLIRVGEQSPAAERRNMAAALGILFTSVVTHMDAWVNSPPFASGYYTVAIASFGVTSHRVTDARSLRNLLLYAGAWLAFRALLVSVEVQRGGTPVTRSLLVGMRWYVLLSFLLRLRLGAVLASGPEGLLNAWLFEDGALNGPVFLYGVTLLQCVALDTTVALELQTEVLMARKRQAVAEALAAGRAALTRFVFHEGEY